MLLGLLTSTALASGAAEGEASNLGATLPLWSTLPFAGMLLSIALFPLLAPRFWRHHYPRVAAAWALIFAVPFLFAYRGSALHEILHIYIADYVPFLILLVSLFTVAGGIVLRGTVGGTPGSNTLLLAIGTLLASCIGTTGASMLLVRPLLRSNAPRRERVHVVVFFIFLVSNVGGALTPLGDPPLFLGFLQGVPFFWTLHLVPEMCLIAAFLLLLFYLTDSRAWSRDAIVGFAPAPRAPVRIEGRVNFVFLAAIVAAVLFSGVYQMHEVQVLGVGVPLQNLLRDLTLVALTLLSLRFTPRLLREANQFGWEPMREVAILFAGIFMTIVPALAILRAGETGPLHALIRGIEKPWQYFWMSGGLSSFLDNAPTYLTFLHSALGRFYPDLPPREAVGALLHEHTRVLAAISAGSVFMGANTYIGNAPNFMVRSIAEEAGVEMPSFFGYLMRWSLPILIPAFLLVTLVFFRA
jgi:Na+/H+ antiporter NhaD/arsenite permease-like protein